MALSIHDRTGVVHANDRLQRVAVANERVRTTHRRFKLVRRRLCPLSQWHASGVRLDSLARALLQNLVKAPGLAAAWRSMRNMNAHEVVGQELRCFLVTRVSGPRGLVGGWNGGRCVGASRGLARSLVRDGAPLIHNVCGRLVRRRTKVEVGRMYGRRRRRRAGWWVLSASATAQKTAMARKEAFCSNNEVVNEVTNKGGRGGGSAVSSGGGRRGGCRAIRFATTSYI